jgi:hypothetical protein
MASARMNQKALASRPFSLPTSVMVSFYKTKSGGYRAHALDFDLVCSSKDAAEAKRKIRLAIKTYIEYGLSKGWESYIIFPAPAECWQRLSPGTPVTVWEPIRVVVDPQGLREQDLPVFVTPHDEDRHAAREAVGA